MFPERLKALRLEANLTQNDVSRQFGVSQPTYSNWEKGEKKNQLQINILRLQSFIMFLRIIF